MRLKLGSGEGQGVIKKQVVMKDFLEPKNFLRRQTIQLEKNTQNLPYSDEDIHYGMIPRVMIQATSVPYNKRLLTTNKNPGQDAKTK